MIFQKLQKRKSSSSKNASSVNISNDTIASQKRLIDLEEEFRVLNGRIDEVLYDLKIFLMK